MNAVRVSAEREWLDHLRARNYSEATLYVREESLDKFHRFLDAHRIGALQEVTREHLEEWRREMFARGLKAATVAQRLRTVRLMFCYLDERGMVFENPARKLRPHLVPKPLPRVPTVEQMKLILEQPDPNTVLGKRDRALLETMYCAGLRLGEATAMKVSDLDLPQKALLVHGKGSKERVLPLGTACVTAIKNYLRDARPLLLGNSSDDGSLWIGVRGQPMRRQAVMVRVVRHIRAAGLKGFSSHSLRRAAATHMLANGASPFAVQEFLGHASLQHLSRYLRVTINELRTMHAGSLPGS